MESGYRENPNKTGDPSANVIMFVGNAVKYLEDLHKAGERSIDEKLKLHFEYTKQISEAESERINALRAVDVAAVATANERAVKQAEVLANQMAANAETLRASVAKTAETIATQLQQITSQQNERIAALEKANYENVGKSSAPSELADKVTELDKIISENRGRTGISSQLIFAVSAIVGGIVVYLVQTIIK